MKLSKNQLIVLTEMAAGVKFYHNPVTNFKPYTKGDYGIMSEKVHGKIMVNLESLGLIKKNRLNFAMYIYEITEVGIKSLRNEPIDGAYCD